MGEGYTVSSGDIMISVTEIILIIVGILAVILGYLIPNNSALNEVDSELTEAKINDLVRKAIRNSQGQIDEMLDECTEEAINKAERAMDRVTNEKMSAISEYSDTVMNDIHKNHDEVMFMYDMLNDKHKNLKNTVSEVNRAAKEVKQTAKEAVLTAEQAEEAARAAKEAAMRVESTPNVVVSEPVAFEHTVSEPVLHKTPDYDPVIREDVSNKNTSNEEFEYFDEDDSDETVVKPENEEETKQFSSLVDILDRADSAAAKKTQNKVIGSEPGNIITPENTFAETENAPVSEVANTEYEHDISETVNETPEYSQEAPVGDVTEMPEIPEADAAEDISGAKVVSISDASRKKAEAAEAQPQLMPGDPASRNQRILDMHKAGKSAVVIARELKLGIGEVKLVIDLAGKHKKNRSSIM